MTELGSPTTEYARASIAAYTTAKKLIGDFEDGDFYIPNDPNSVVFDIRAIRAGHPTDSPVIKIWKGKREYTLDPRNPDLVRVFDSSPTEKKGGLFGFFKSTPQPKTKLETAEIVELAKDLAASVLTPLEVERRKEIEDINKEAEREKRRAEARLWRIEEERQEKIEKARACVKELEAIDGKKCLALVLDDYREKRGDVLARVKESSSETKFVIREFATGEAAIEFFQIFKTEAGDKYPVAAFLDGNLGDTGGIRNGITVAKMIDKMANDNGWETPYFIGISNSNISNESLRHAYPDKYIGSFMFKPDPVCQILDERLKV